MLPSVTSPAASLVGAGEAIAGVPAAGVLPSDGLSGAGVPAVLVGTDSGSAPPPKGSWGVDTGAGEDAAVGVEEDSTAAASPVLTTPPETSVVAVVVVLAGAAAAAGEGWWSEHGPGDAMGVPTALFESSAPAVISDSLRFCDRAAWG